MSSRHSWERVPTYIAADKSPDGNERQERVCQHPDCGLTKITVIPPRQPPYPWRRWRWPGRADFQYEHTPECRAVAAAAPELSEAS